MSHIFKGTLELGPGIQEHWTSKAEDLGVLEMAIPPAFQGPGGAYSPEDLFGMALANCFGATFKFWAERSRLDYRKLETDYELSPGKNDQGKMIMKSLKLSVRLYGVTDREKAEGLILKASESCMILNSTVTEKTLESEILD